jgi:hypothetical protein
MLVLVGLIACTSHRAAGALTLSMVHMHSKWPILSRIVAIPQINRLRVIKRQIYGRAGFELLKARVLPLSV